jgi:hypothetical protein
MAEARSAVSTGQCKNCPTPDIYLIVTDGYAGKEQLEKYFHFDNRAFEDSLQALGFYVVDSSFSNYSSTSQSMTSLLNMHYNVIEGEDAHVQINQNNTTAFFEKMGYQVHNNSIFKLAEQFPKRPIGYFKTGIGLIRYHTFFAHLEAVIHNSLSNWQVESERQKMQNAIDERTHKESIRDSLTLQELLDGVSPKRSSPKFVYSHFMMPHPPYLFSEDGQQPDTSASPEKQYISYLQYTNKQLLKAAKRILQYSTEPPVIILLSDHGFRNDDLPHPTPFRFSNLVAVYLPNKQRKLFYKGLSNVNIFRVLLNHQFEQNLPFLKDSTCY